MPRQPEQEQRTISISAILLGCMVGVAVICSDLFYFQTGLLGEGLPDLSPERTLRSAAVLLSLVLITIGVTGGRVRTVETLKYPSTYFERLGMLSAVSVSGLFLLLFLIDPVLFNEMSLEDGPIEWASALVLLCCCVIFVMSFLRVRKQPQASVFTLGALMILAFVFFVIAMEEVSWFQRVLDLDSPDSFAANEQGEFNFHNFATNRIENVYYFGAFLFLVVLPLQRVFLPTLTGSVHLAPLLPRPFVAVIGAIACAYSFDMWNIALTQITFFGSIIALFLYVLLSNNIGERIAVFCTLVLLTVTQGVFLANGDNFSRLWTITEYKELLIPLGFLAYSMSVNRGISQA